MAEPTRSGRPKIDAALDAARTFLGLLDLRAPPAPGGDRAAIVAFHAEAWILAPLTADRAALEAALDTVVLGQQTRLDRAVAVGAATLADASRRRPGNLPVLVVLTDGRANPVPVGAAVAEAAAAKAAGVTVFTIGLGDDVEAEALATMASSPAGFLRAPDGEDLAAAYAEVARELPCPLAWPAGGR
jgi:Mg-chelatase subunit ChlD